MKTETVNAIVLNENKELMLKTLEQINILISYLFIFI